MKIAIIEDDKITRLELSKLLNSHGYETVLLTDFENLSEESKKYSFDLILLDINLPYENGYEICRKMKKLMSVPIIFVTSRDTSADELLSIQAGGIDFITKPYDTLILLEKIKRALQLSNPNNFRELTKKRLHSRSSFVRIKIRRKKYRADKERISHFILLFHERR